MASPSTPSGVTDVLQHLLLVVLEGGPRRVVEWAQGGLGLLDLLHVDLVAADDVVADVGLEEDVEAVVHQLLGREGQVVPSRLAHTERLGIARETTAGIDRPVLADLRDVECVCQRGRRRSAPDRPRWIAS